jgi:PDZ domain-containing secreted protein
MSENKGGFLAILLVIALIIAILYFSATPGGKAQWNTWFFGVQKADDATNYDTLKKVEDTARAMIASYMSDKLTYEMYQDSTSSEKQGWGEQAKMRANKTAATYNAYVLENSFIWKDNVPEDIKRELPIIK